MTVLYMYDPRYYLRNISELSEVSATTIQSNKLQKQFELIFDSFLICKTLL